MHASFKTRPDAKAATRMTRGLISQVHLAAVRP